MNQKSKKSTTRSIDPEQKRLEQADNGGEDWRLWGPYLSERQWGTVREDYSPHGTAWDYLSHDMSRSRAYRWGEDGLAGFSDDQARLCLSVALWNGRDPILKERIFGLTNSEGNHGEDVKELYYYLDGLPSHAYMKYPLLVKDPHFRDHRLFFENFHGDSGRGVGANHQTGWTGVVANLLMPDTTTN